MAKKKTSAKSSPPRDETEPAEGGGEAQADFEESLAEIEKIVLQLEGGELSLAESLEKYERAIGRLKQCHRLLDAAEQQVTVLAGFDAEGNPVTETLEELEGHSGGGTGDTPRAGRRGTKKTSSGDSPGGVGDASGDPGHVDGSRELF